MTEFERITELRLNYTPTASRPALCVVDPPNTVDAVHHARGSVQVCGILYQRCGGGRRVLRKKISN